jgi:energy-coupling factor transporter ATP-binding protein EcfA2
LDNFHQACYSGTRQELLSLLARWIAGKDVQIDVDDDLNVDEGSEIDEDFDTDDDLGTDNDSEEYDWEDRRQTHRRSSFRRVFASLRQCACIVGSPGSGKSTIATTVIAKLLDHIHHHCPGLVSAHYCIRKTDTSTLHPNKVFPSIVLELARASPAIAQSIDKILTPLFSNGLSVEAKQIQLLLEPIRQYDGTVLILIDALDESSNPSSFASTLSRLIPQLPTNVRLILTTRPENDVLVNLGDDLVEQIKLEIHTHQSFMEVKRYMESRIGEGIQVLFKGRPGWDTWWHCLDPDRCSR